MIETLVSNIVSSLLGATITYFAMKWYHGKKITEINDRLKRVETRFNDYEAGEIIRAVAINGNGNKYGR